MADPIDHGVSRTLPLPPLGGRVPPYMRPLRSPRPIRLALTGLPSTKVRTARLPHWGRGHQSRPSHSIFPASTGLPPTKMRTARPPPLGEGSPIEAAAFRVPRFDGPAPHQDAHCASSPAGGGVTNPGHPYHIQSTFSQRACPLARAARPPPPLPHWGRGHHPRPPYLHPVHLANSAPPRLPTGPPH